MVFDKEPESPVSYKTRCYNSELTRAIPENIQALEEFVDKHIWMAVGESVYSKAFSFFKNSPVDEERGWDH